ncbi:uncharacterized membrane-anchored protein YjiN (DUF445 family) [Peribacillus deserti]|uniref:Uncharacterized membrane-anchored protein YjiN (DUF445 family) n=1 Tax=Peribacillus deserti TaxID=673318 RepID=A0ABS2QKY8_9BACI|nr:DUF445 domain-containing protein [Peribacillus deserti]MBM7693675.1 uncharacterized membrane-anchored protein YjiN (DUF445 family) [Peribacillus deserti]
MFNSSRHLARLSLIIMGAGFLATIPFQDSLIGRLLQGGFEAGIVGGLADWFAVTALFRHPLGLPIPHTALLPKNRDRMVTALVNILETNWLTKESIKEKIKQISITNKVLSVTQEKLGTEAAKKGIESILIYGIKQVNVEKVTPFIERKLKEYLASVQLASLLKNISDHTIARKYDEKLLDRLLAMIETWLKKENRSYQLGSVALQALDSMEFDGFLQFAIKSFRGVMSEEKLGNIIHSLLAGGVDSLKREDNPNRQALLLYIRKELQGIPENEKLIAEMEDFKLKLTAEWEPAGLINENLHKLKQLSLEKIQDRKLMDTYLMPYLEQMLSSLQNNQKQVDKIEDVVQNQIARIVEDNHAKIGKLVKENLDKLDNETLIEMMENNIGKDLQWIRVNGAVCGFIIGIGITVFKLFL